MASPPKAHERSSEDEDAPVSISSLRSKFESLAAGSGSKEAGSVVVRKPIAGRTNPTIAVGPVIDTVPKSDDGVLVSGMSEEQSIRIDRQSRPSSRPVTPSPAVILKSSPAQPESVPVPSAIAKKLPPPKPVKPIIMSTPASPKPPSPPPPGSESSGRIAEVSSGLDAPQPSAPQFARRSAPHVPGRIPSAASSPISVQDDPEHVEPAPSVKSLRERFAGGLTAPEAGPSRSRSGSPSFDGPSGRVSPTLMARKDFEPFQRSSDKLVVEPISATFLSSSPLQVESSIELVKKAQPPPRPIFRSASPAPPQPDRSTKPIPAKSQQPSPAYHEDKSAVDQTESASEPISRPMLPVRRPTIRASTNTSGPPPIPGNRPSTDPASRRGNASDIGPGPPKLPSRIRAQTMNQSEDTRVGAPPPLPIRQATTSISSLSGIAPPSHSHTISLPVSPARSLDTTDMSDYQPPPPPVRSTTHVPTPPRRNDLHPPARTDGDLSSEDDEEEEPAALSSLPAGVKRVLEEYPDSTHANRRPPKFHPDIRMIQPHHIYAFAVFGRHVCTGAHHIRIYDTQMSERPISIVELRDTGLEFRVKEPRVSAMCFRPGAHPSDEGRYLWCGTRDGHVFEVDIMTTQVSDARPGAHGASVSHIFRYGQYILTLDEAGKLLVYDVPTSNEKDSDTSPTLIRTMRVSERSTFARLIQGRLWTATAPQTRSTTNAASKGATIRVYEPCIHNPPPARTLFTTEWTGAVTSATILPLAPETVYLGHEGGFVSIWSSEEMACQQVIKISASDILALEGCGERLWAGNRKGQIWVYDVSQKPWQATNIWLAHA